MELPFAFTDESSTNDSNKQTTSYHSSVPNHHHAVVDNSSKSKDTNSSTRQHNLGVVGPPPNTTATGSNTKTNKNNVSNDTLLPRTSPAYQNVNTSTLPLPSPPANSKSNNNNSNSNNNNPIIQQRAALYDNLHPQFYNPPSNILSSIQSQTISSSVHKDKNDDTNSSKIKQRQIQQIPLNSYQSDHNSDNIEDSFVTIYESDIKDDYHTSQVDMYNRQLYYNNNYNHPHSSSSNLNCELYNLTSFDILSVLLSGPVTTTISLPNYSNQQQEQQDFQNHNNNDNIVTLCSDASKFASLATKYCQEGNMKEAILNHTKSAKNYRKAALMIKNHYTTNHNSNNHKGKRNSDGDVTINPDNEIITETASSASTATTSLKSSKHFTSLSYSLLVLSHSQAKSANTLLRNSGNLNLHNSEEKSNDMKPSSPPAMTENTKNNDNIISRHDTKKSNQSSTSPSLSSSVSKEDTQDRRLSNKEERLRATIRASLGGQVEADMTQSTFLGRATSTTQPTNNKTQRGKNGDETNHQNLETKSDGTNTKKTVDDTKNPVDDMMELERELRDMDMTLEIGLGLGGSNNLSNNKKGMDPEGSFCLIPSSSSYMSSSVMWSSGIGGRQAPSHAAKNSQAQTFSGNAGARARANRVQTILDASSASIHKGGPNPAQQSVIVQQQHLQQDKKASDNVTHITTSSNPPPAGLELSWWGHASAMASSTASLSNSMIGNRYNNTHLNVSHHNPNPHGGGGPSQNNLFGEHETSSAANTKQLVRLLDSLKTLGDENAALLREVEDAQKARSEAQAARESMRVFKEEYGKRFATLKAALEKFRRDHAENIYSTNPNLDTDTTPSSSIPHSSNIFSNNSSNTNVIASSSYIKNADEIRKRDQMIQKLSMDLKTIRQESKKKDDALKKYENFYKEVKARSALKAKQKEEEQRKGTS